MNPITVNWQDLSQPATGMKLVHWIEFPQWKFTVYFLELQKAGQVRSSAETFGRRVAATLRHPHARAWPFDSTA